MVSSPDTTAVRSDPSDQSDPFDPKALKSQCRWVLYVAASVMAVTMIPYLFGYSLTGVERAFGWFSWFGYNLDDSAVYLSWLRQAADGAFFQRNLFTTDAQPAGQFNLFFIALGLISRVTTLPPIAVWHLARLLFGIWMLCAVHGLISRVISGERSQKAAFLFVCLSAGLGWLPGLWVDFGQSAPVDVWQPEAIMFLSLYLNPLFIVSLLIMVGFLIGLIDAERTGSFRKAALAGLCGFLLGNIHGYDVITLTAIWALYLVVRMVGARSLLIRGLACAAIAFPPAFLSAGYQYYLLKSNPIFAARVNVETLSPSLGQYFLGFGLLIPLAVAGAWILVRRPTTDDGRPITQRPNDLTTLLICWVVANLAVAYLPVPFQRKMIMGLHLPICMLAGAAMGFLLVRASTTQWRVALVVVVMLTAVTNVRFMLRDAAAYQSNVAQSMIQRPYLMSGENRALDWLRANAAPGTPIQPLPWIPVGESGRFDTTMASFAPGLTGLSVHAGHWGETPDFDGAIRKWGRFAAGMPVEAASELLSQSGVRYIVTSQILEPALRIPPAYLEALRPLLKLIPDASFEGVEVYEVLIR